MKAAQLRRQRRSVRVPCRIPVRWRRQPNPIDLMAQDINQHGFFLSTEIAARPDELIHLEIDLPTQRIVVFGVARFVGATAQGRGIGVEIFVMDDRFEKAWTSYYRELLAAHTEQLELTNASATSTR
jgi:hypothetical protein